MFFALDENKIFYFIFQRDTILFLKKANFVKKKVRQLHKYIKFYMITLIINVH